MATGSQPTGDGFQRAVPQRDRLPGVDLPGVWSVDDVMASRARLGEVVVLLDDTGDWRGAGTAWHLAERGHRVVIVCPHPLVGAWLQRTGGDADLRARLARLGATWHTESVVDAWNGTSVTVRSLLDGTTTEVDADALVLATINTSDDTALRELDAPDVLAAGDVVAPRLAVHAIYEGRVAGMSI
ncbi:MAG: hypothetical protein R2713_05370 [Ilumatobacteraceae bacterium]